MNKTKQFIATTLMVAGFSAMGLWFMFMNVEEWSLCILLVTLGFIWIEEPEWVKIEEVN